MGNAARKSSKLNHVVFWPPFLLLVAAVTLNFTSPKAFDRVTSNMNAWVLGNFGWLFLLVGFSCVLLCLAVSFSPLGKVRLGGSDAKPKLKMWNWFAITVCTTVAVGILLWSTAEPMLHFSNPPESLDIEAGSPDAARFAMSRMYLHWTFTPYAIYAVASLMFAFAYYNMKLPYSLGSPLAPLLGEAVTGRTGNVIDAVCLYSLVAGMAASLGSGIMVLAAGLSHLWPVLDAKSPTLRAVIALAVIATFIASSASGLMKGIRILSSVNTYALFALGIFMLICGPTVFILNFGLEVFGSFLTHFPELNLYLDSLLSFEQNNPQEASSSWAQSWTLFYWAVWMAWAPITACFLGQIAYGRTVREFMLVNFLLPALFGAVWMAIFSGTALHLEMSGAADFTELVQADSDGRIYPERVAFSLFSHMPLTLGLVIFYVVSSFICFVTSADSNTTAMAAISSSGITPENSEGGLAVKVVWGLTVGVVAWVMICFADIDGIKIISALGGFPALFLLILVIGSLTKVMLNVERYNVIDRDSQPPEKASK